MCLSQSSLIGWTNFPFKALFFSLAPDGKLAINDDEPVFQMSNSEG